VICFKQSLISPIASHPQVLSELAGSDDIGVTVKRMAGIIGRYYDNSGDVPKYRELFQDARPGDEHRFQIALTSTFSDMSNLLVHKFLRVQSRVVRHDMLDIWTEDSID
jgi:hypothetical protein